MLGNIDREGRDTCRRKESFLRRREKEERRRNIPSPFSFLLFPIPKPLLLRFLG